MKHAKPTPQPATALVALAVTFGICAATAADLRSLSTDRPDATDTLQLDGGVRVGLNSASTEFSPFLGFSVKF